MVFHLKVQNHNLTLNVQVGGVMCTTTTINMKYTLRSCSVAVITLPCHGKDREFDSRQDRYRLF